MRGQEWQPQQHPSIVSLSPPTMAHPGYAAAQLHTLSRPLISGPWVDPCHASGIGLHSEISWRQAFLNAPHTESRAQSEPPLQLLSPQRRSTSPDANLESP